MKNKINIFFKKTQSPLLSSKEGIKG